MITCFTAMTVCFPCALEKVNNKYIYIYIYGHAEWSIIDRIVVHRLVMDIHCPLKRDGMLLALLFVVFSQQLGRIQNVARHIDGSVQGWGIYIAKALDILQSCPKPSIYTGLALLCLVVLNIGCVVWCGSIYFIWYPGLFLSLAQSKLRLCSANHRAGYFNNLTCDWLRIVWAYSEQETENGPGTDRYMWSV